MGTRINREGNNKNNNIIGTPSDGSYSDGFFDEWESNTLIGDAIDDISELIKDIVPDKAPVLDNVNLNSNIIKYNAKLSNGLDNVWYQDNKIPGDIINSYVINNSLQLLTDWFRAGKKNKPETYGILKLLDNTLQIDEYDISNGIGNSINLFITNLEIFNNLWNRVKASAIISLSSEGYHSYNIEHTEAGITNLYKVWYDDNPGPLLFDVLPGNLIDTEVIKYLSGIEYLTLGSVINVSYTAGIGIFRKCYHISNVSNISCIGLNTVIRNPISIPNSDDIFSISTQIILDKPNEASNNPYITVKLNRPESNISENTPVIKRICTYGIVSTNTIEYFYDEDKRLINNTNDTWDSVVPLFNGEAQVMNGKLVYGILDYIDKTGPQEYQRKFNKTAASTGSLKFEGIIYNNVSPYGTGDLNILIYLDNDNLWFDLGRVVGDKNGDGSGNTKENSIGGQINGVNDLINWSIGINSTAYNNQQFRISIIFNNNNKEITKIISS